MYASRTRREKFSGHDKNCPQNATDHEESGNEFQAAGPATEKARRPNIERRCRGKSSRLQLPDRRCCRQSMSKVWMQQSFMYCGPCAADTRYTRKHKVLGDCRPAGRGGFLIHVKTIPWRWRTSTMVRKSVPDDQSDNAETCGVPLLFLARPELHVLLNRDRLGQEDSPSVGRHAGNMQEWRLGYR